MTLPAFILCLKLYQGMLTVPAVLPANVIAPQVAVVVNSLASKIPPMELTVIFAAASTFPLKRGAPSVAELPTTQKTFFAWAGGTRIMFPGAVVVRVLLSI